MAARSCLAFSLPHFPLYFFYSLLLLLYLGCFFPTLSFHGFCAFLSGKGFLCDDHFALQIIQKPLGEFFHFPVFPQSILFLKSPSPGWKPAHWTHATPGQTGSAWTGEQAPGADPCTPIAPFIRSACVTQRWSQGDHDGQCGLFTTVTSGPALWFPISNGASFGFLSSSNNSSSSKSWFSNNENNQSRFLHMSRCDHHNVCLCSGKVFHHLTFWKSVTHTHTHTHFYYSLADDEMVWSSLYTTAWHGSQSWILDFCCPPFFHAVCYFTMLYRQLFASSPHSLSAAWLRIIQPGWSSFPEKN